MDDKKYGKFNSSYSREISMNVTGKNLNDEQYEVVSKMCQAFKGNLMNSLDDISFEFPQSLEVKLSNSDSRR